MGNDRAKLHLLYFMIILLQMVIADKLGIMSLSKKIGKNLKKLRTEKNMTQGDIVRATGLNRAYVSSLETGKRNPTLANIEKIAKALQVPPRELLSE